MSPGAALRDIRGYAAAWRIRFAAHARQRMAQRGATVEDVRHALMNARGCEAAERHRWKVMGKDLDDDNLTAIVVLENSVIVVTVF